MRTGAAFSDHIKTEKKHKHHYDGDQPHSQRAFILILSLIVLPGILFFKLFSLQVVHGSYYRNLSDTNRTRTKIIHAPRGVIFDRNGVPLVYNIPGFREIQGENTILLNREKAIELLSQGREDLEIDTLRQYPLKDAGAHVLGYVGQISKDELSLPEFANYSGTDVSGKTGIEQQYEHLLRGVDGKELIEVDAMGKKIRTLGQTDPIPGKDIVLTLDAKLQKTTYEALEPHTKAAVVVTTPDGEILSMVSKPSFDPNLFTMDKTYSSSGSAYKNISAILTDTTNQPLMNRTVSGVYPPGSTFKLITAAAALEKHIINNSFTVEDTGIIKIGAFSFANWYYLEHGKTDGTVDTVKAIARSNDIFFYKLAEKVKVDRLSEFAQRFGLGKQLGIDVAGEASGILPSDAWKRKNIGEQWYLGDTYHYGIGQGYLLTTPLQVNAWTDVFANGGVVRTPHLLKNPKPEMQQPAAVSKLLSENTISVVRQGMIDSCSPGGVAWPFFKFKVKNEKLKIDGKDFLAVPVGSASAGLKDAQKYREIIVACKTGTAQVGDEQTKPHAWITLYAPAYQPQLVVTVLVESAGQGSDMAGPVAKKILEDWFTR